MDSPVTCPDCGARRAFVGFAKVAKGEDEIRIFHCKACDLTERLQIAKRQAVVVARSHGRVAKG